MNGHLIRTSCWLFFSPPQNSPPISCHSESALGLPLCGQKETPLLAFMLLVEQQEDLARRAAPGAAAALIGRRQERAPALFLD